MSGVTVIGLVQGGCLLEDIRTTVPHRMAIQIPAPLAERSQDLVDALQQRRVMRLGAAAVVKESTAQLNTSLRGRGIAPVAPARIDMPAPSAALLERETLVLELETSREQCRSLQRSNEALQATLQGLTTQLAQIQGALDILLRDSRRGGPLPEIRRVPDLDGAAPHFIPDTIQGAAEMRLNLAETTSTSNLDEAQAALRLLRGKSALKL